MSFIFNELEYAESLLEYGPKKSIKNNDLYILGRYYSYMGYDLKEIRNGVESFLKKYNTGYNEVLFSNQLDKIVKDSVKIPLRIPKPVYITKNEINKIRSVHNYKMEKILFVLLVVSRYYKLMRDKEYNGYYVNQTFSSILSLAHVYAKKSDKEIMQHVLRDLGFIRPIEPDGIHKSNGKDNLQLLYDDENSEKTIYITDMNKIIEFYPFFCSVCGKITEKKSNRQKMCDECFYKNRREYENERMRKSRNSPCAQLDQLAQTMIRRLEK